MSVVPQDKVCRWAGARVCLLQCEMLCALWRESDSSLEQSDLGVHSVQKKARTDNQDRSMDDPAPVHVRWYPRSKGKSRSRWGRRGFVSPPSAAPPANLQSPTPRETTAYPSTAKTIQSRKSTTTTNGSATSLVATTLLFL